MCIDELIRCKVTTNIVDNLQLQHLHKAVAIEPIPLNIHRLLLPVLAGVFPDILFYHNRILIRWIIVQSARKHCYYPDTDR